MAEGIELAGLGSGSRDDVVEQPDDDETEFNEIVNSGTAELPSDTPAWAAGEETPTGWKPEEVASKKDTDRRVAEFDAARRNAGYRSTRQPSMEFRAKQDGTLYVKWGRNWVRLTSVVSPRKFLSPATVSRLVGRLSLIHI